MAKQRVKRTRNGGTMTEAQYWGAIRSALRSRFAGMRPWRPASEAIKAARREKTSASGPGAHRFEYKCAICGGWFRVEKVQADHVVPVGALNRLEDLPGFVARLTPEDPAAFQCVCHECHAAKTREDRDRIKLERATA